jgi:hypothetical protein
MNFDIQTLSNSLTSLSHPHPARDWLLIATLALLLFFAGAGVGVYLFLGAQTGTLISSPTEVPKPTIPVTQAAIRAVLEAYQQRAANYAAKSFVVVDLVDPRPVVKKK